MRPLLALIGCVLASLAAGGVGALATRSAPAFYGSLDRPPWAPPPWVFGPVWTILYLLMGTAAWLVWMRRGSVSVHRALWLFATQLVLNAAWSWIFFAWRQGAFAIVEILALLVALAATVASFWRVRPLAGALLLPYLGWVCFASILTIAVVQANAGKL